MRKWIRIAIVVLAVFLRFYDLGKAPLFFDESVHTVFVDNVLSGTYKYDPAFHGPLLFYLTAGVVSVLGKNEFTYRLIPAIFGVLTVLLLFKFERFIGRGADYSTLLVAISPIIVNYSRFFRNDSQILFFTLAFVYFIFSYLRDKKCYQLVLASISLALFACSKENFYPIAILLLLYFVFDIKKFKVRDVAIAVVFFLLLYSAFYTNFYTYTTPFTNFSEFPVVKAIVYWKHQHEIARIGGPWWYYIPLLLLYDLPVFILGVYAIANWIYRKKNDFRAFLIYWFVVNLVFYSYVQEKVPWLVVHIELPLYIIAGVCIAEIRRVKVRYLALLLTVVFLIYSCVQLNIVNPTNPAEPALYLPTSMDVKEFRDNLKAMNVSRVCVFMSPGDYWPLPCYLKDFKTYYFPSVNNFKETIKAYDCDVVILNETNAKKVEGVMKNCTKTELCLRSWVSYSYESLNPIRILEFLIFRKPMGTVCYFNHTVYYVR
ncbi:flippase activity-associated protein Agl23 [Archaeoglobus sp.]